MKNKKIIIGMLLVLLLAGCGTHLEVVDLDPETGKFPTGQSATIVSEKPFDVDERKTLIVVPSGGFSEGMIENLDYFENVITVEELEEVIVREDLVDKVSSLTDRIGLSKAARAYKPFLWLHWDNRSEGNKSYLQLKLVDPLTLEDLFVAETYMDYIWVGVSDERNRYPLFNALKEYLRENSSSY